MLDNLVQRADGIKTEIDRILNEDDPLAVFFVAFHKDRDRHNSILFTSNLLLRGLASELRHLADLYDAEADINGEVPRLQVQ